MTRELKGLKGIRRQSVRERNDHTSLGDVWRIKGMELYFRSRLISIFIPMALKSRNGVKKKIKCVKNGRSIEM